MGLEVDIPKFDQYVKVWVVHAGVCGCERVGASVCWWQAFELAVWDEINKGDSESEEELGEGELLDEGGRPGAAAAQLVRPVPVVS